MQLLPSIGASLLLFLSCCNRLPAQDRNNGSSFWQQALTDISGQPIHLDDPQFNGLAIIFVTPDCPISNAFQPELRRITEDYQDRGVLLILVHVAPQVDLATAQKHARDYEILAPVVLDNRLELAQQLQATTVPSAFVFEGPSRTLVYHGRIDNRFESLGKKRQQATTRELRTALDAILNKQKLDVNFAEPVGCRINFTANSPGK